MRQEIGSQIRENVSPRTYSLSALREGEQSVWDRLHTEMHPKLLRYAERLVPGHGEDCAQGAWLAFWEKLGTPNGLRPDTIPARFLYRVTHHKAVDVLRGGMHLPQTESAIKDELLEKVPSQAASTESLGIQRTAGTIFDALGVQSSRDREIAVLASYGFSYEEIAQRLGLTSGNVRLINHRMKQKAEQNKNKIL